MWRGVFVWVCHTHVASLDCCRYSILRRWSLLPVSLFVTWWWWMKPLIICLQQVPRTQSDTNIRHNHWQLDSGQVRWWSTNVLSIVCLACLFAYLGFYLVAIVRVRVLLCVSIPGSITSANRFSSRVVRWFFLMRQNYLWACVSIRVGMSTKFCFGWKCRRVLMQEWMPVKPLDVYA